MSISQLWTEKYRPKTVENFVFVDPDLRTQVETWIQEKNFPHLLFHGSPGTGKTTLAKIIINGIGVEHVDVLYVNGSKEGRRIEWLRDTLTGFCQTMPFGFYKVVMIDEADYLNTASVQPALRNLMEEYSDSTRFMLTCNYPNRIIPPLRSRCHEVIIERPDLVEFTARAATVLMQENTVFDIDTLDNYVRATYPDLRKCLNLLQPNSVTGTLRQATAVNRTTDHMLEAVTLIKAQQLRQARQLICGQIRPDEFESIYRWAYNNLDLWSASDQGQDEAIKIIARGLINHNSCADSEINLSATLTELMGVTQ